MSIKTPLQPYVADHRVEPLEPRKLLAADTVVPLPFRLDFNQNLADTIVDKDGQGTGFTRIQSNKFGTEYQQNLIDLDVNQGVLKLTTTGTSSAGSNAGSDNTQTNALETQFDGTTSGFAINARLIGPLSNLNDPYEQAGIFFGPDQDNYVKLVAIRVDGGQVLQFKREVDGANQISDSQTWFDIGSFGSINTLDVRIVGDAVTGKVSAFYSVNGGAFAKLSLEYTIDSSKRSAFFNGASRAGLLTSHKNNVGPITATFDYFEITAGTSINDRPRIIGTRPGAGATNVNRDDFVAADVFLPNSGAGVDTSTISQANVKLYRQSDGALVTGVINTTGGGDAIVFTPSSPLMASTTYVFEITDGVKDTTGASFVPYTSTFTTGTQGGEVDTSVYFSKTAQSTTQGVRHTSLVFGPDGKLYATTIDGKILRYTVGSNGTLSSAQEILTIQQREGGRRTAMSIVFDPASTANNLIAYISHSDFAGLELKEYDAENLGPAAQWSGKITKVWGNNLQNSQDLVVGLPRSVRDHQNYQLAFGGDGNLYVSQSSMSAMGAPDTAWGNKPETLLSAAILQINVAAIGSGTINVQTEGLGAGNYNPFATDAPVKIYATGLRSAYDILFHSNGRMYSATNGSAAGGKTPAGGGVVGLNDVATQPDLLFKVTEGKYYGHPNPLRGEYVLGGGNPTSGADPGEVGQYPVGTNPDSDWGGFVYNFGFNYSPNGMIEYKGNAFGGKLDGSLMIVRYSGGDDIMVMDTGTNGNITETHRYGGLSGFVNPLDIAQDPATGNLYVIEFGDQATLPGADARITLLKPASAPLGVPTLSRGKVYFSDQTNNSASSAAQAVRLTNDGQGPLTITGFSLGGNHPSEFTVRDAFGNVISTPITLQPGEHQDFYITFKATTTGTRTATLNIATDEGTQQVSLRALGLSGTGGSLEPSLQKILDLYQIGINVGDNDPNTTDFPVDTATSADEVIMPRLVKASGAPVTVEVLGVFANQNAATVFGWYEAGNPQTKHAVTSIPTSGGQSIAPLADGKFSFDPGSGAFGIYGNFTLGSTSNPLNRDVFSENVLNTWESNSSRQKKVRFYQLKDANGIVTPNAYVVAFEEYNVTFDQNDIVAIIRNVQPAAAGPELGLENRDQVPFADRLVMSRIKESGWNTDLPNEFHDVSTLRIRNTGNQNLDITSITSSSADFVIESGGGARTLAPNQFVDVVVRFVYDRTSNGNTVRNGTLTIQSNDPDEATKQVQLAGLWQSHSEDAPTGGSQEPVLQKIIDSLGYKIDVGNQNTNGNPTRAGEEVLSEHWQRADAGLPVKITQLAAYHQQYNVDFTTKSSIFWYNPTNINSTTGKPNTTRVFTHAQVDSQSLLPRLDGSTTQLAQGQFIPNGVSQFGFRVDGVYSTDVHNTPNDKNNAGHGIRFYQAKDASGKIIPDTYILAQDYVGVSYANYDYQDNVYLISNVKPVTPPAKASTPTAAGSASGIQLNWNATAEGNVTGYHVYRASSSSGPFVKITSDAVTGTSFFDATAPAGATSFYKIASVSYHGAEGEQSNAANAFRSGAPATAPGAPSNAQASAQSGTSVLISWTDNSSNETGFRVERLNGATWQSVGTTAGTSLVDSTAQPNTSYTYRVLAYNAAGDSPASNQANVTTPQAAAMTSTNIGNPTPTPQVTTVTNGSDYDVTTGGLDIWGTYDSFNYLHQQMTGDFDVKVRITDLNASADNAMAGLMVRETLSTGSRHVMLKARPSGYRLNYRSSTNGATVGVGSGSINFAAAWMRMQRVGDTINTFTSTDGVNWTPFGSVNMAMGSSVYVGLATASASSSQAMSVKYRSFGNTDSGQQPTAPAAPSNLVSNAVAYNQVNLTWLDNATNETGYLVQRRTGGGVWSTIATLGANTSGYTDNTVAASTSYTYRVIAAGAIDSQPSNESSATTPAAPTQGTVTLNPSADSYVSPGSTADANYGTESGLRVKFSSNAQYHRHGYMKFDISSLGQTSSVKLRLYAYLNSGGSVGMSLHGVSDNSWTETGITWNNKPAAGASLGTAVVTSTTGEWIEFDVTAHVQQAIAAGQSSISFNLQGVASTSPFITIASRETGANAPQLVAGTDQPPTPQPPAAATGAAAQASSPTSVTVTWTDASNNETGFRIMRRSGGGAWSQAGTVGAGVQSFVDSTVQPSTSYEYQVFAYNGTGDAPGSNIASVTTPQQQTGTTLSATADSYVSPGSTADTNFGTESGLRVKFSSNAQYHRHGYMKFDISSLSSPASVKLRLWTYLNSGGTVAMTVHGVSDNSWTETGITWNNKPAAGASLGTAVVTSTTGQWIEIDVTSYVQQAIANGAATVSFNFQGVASTSPFITIASRESGATAPTLVVS